MLKKLFKMHLQKLKGLGLVVLFLKLQQHSRFGQQCKWEQFDAILIVQSGVGLSVVEILQGLGLVQVSATKRWP